ncbi:MAG: hypothetical protein EBZ55_04170 [Actinobacteria bacterium]|nr:hypothetical protein [Actinomycetota bacterium]
MDHSTGPSHLHDHEQGDRDMKKAHRFVVTGVDAAGAPTPVMAKITCQKNGDPFFVHAAVEAVHGYARNQREEGYVVTVDWLFEVPEEHLEWWANYYLATQTQTPSTTKEQ